MMATVSNAGLGEKTYRTVQEWSEHLVERFPRSVDRGFLQGLSILWGVGGPAFWQERSVAHMKRLLWLQYMLCKRAARERQTIDVRIFCRAFRLCVAIRYCVCKVGLSDEAILEVVGQKMAALKKVEESVYKWENRATGFFYVELEKMRGRQLSVSEIRELERHLEMNLGAYLAEPTVFWPYNHEDALKQLLVLEKEVSSTQEAPQVSLHFQKQTTRDVEFLVYMARAKLGKGFSGQLVKEQFPLSSQLVMHVREEIHSQIPKIVEAFSIVVPQRYFKEGGATNLLCARDYVVKVLEGVVGPVRDYNGGLFETQKARFTELATQFAHKIPYFSQFGKEIFYS